MSESPNGDQEIPPLDTGGVALEAIQGLKSDQDRRLAELTAVKDREIAGLRSELALLKKQVSMLLKKGDRGERPAIAGGVPSS